MASSSSATNSQQQQQRNGSDSLVLDELKATIDMNCSVCFEVFTDPLLLRCGHTFCKKCTDSLIRCARENAQQNYRYGATTIACPECRAEMPADQRYLVKNFRLADIIGQFNLLQTDSKDTAARASSSNAVQPLPPALQITCDSCNEKSDPKHIFCCLWCSNGRQEPFFACGTCCVTKHPQHSLTPYAQMSTPEERQVFVTTTMSMLRDAASDLTREFDTVSRITPEYQNIKNKINDSFVHWDPVLNNLRSNPKLTKQSIEEHNVIVDNFLRLCFDTIGQVKQTELAHANDLVRIREAFDTKVTAAFNKFSQSSNSPSMPSTSSIAAPTGNEFVYQGSTGRRAPRRIVQLARRRMNQMNPIRATTIFPLDPDRHDNNRLRLPPPQRQSQIDSDEDL